MPARAASVRTFVVSWKLAAEIKLELCTAAFVIPSNWVLAVAEDQSLPLLERIKFAGIIGMLHDEFFMKRISGLKRQMRKRSPKPSLDGRTPREEFVLCRDELLQQMEILTRVLNDELRPGLARAGVPLVDYADLDGNLLIANDPWSGVTVREGRLILPSGAGLGLQPAG